MVKLDIEVIQLWIQEKVADSTIELIKVHTRENLADALTKYVGSDELQRHITHTSHEIMLGRHQLAPGINQLEELQDSQLMIACVCNYTSGHESN